MSKARSRFLLPLVVALFVAIAPVYGATLQSGDFVVGPTSPGKWGPALFGTGAAVTYSFMPSGPSCAAEAACTTITALATFMPGGYQAAIEAAFAAWSAIANLTFIEVPDNGADFNGVVASGDIRFGGHDFDGAFGTLAHGFFPPANGFSAAGDIHFDIAETWKIGFGGSGLDIFQVAAHEIGHALGLNHSAVAGSLMNPNYTEAFSGPQADDIAGMQSIYGPAAAATVPEPSTVLLLGIGLTGLVTFQRRRAA